MTSASRIFIAGGIALIAAGMIFGDIFAVFVLHQNADRMGEVLSAVTRAVARRDSSSVLSHFSTIGGFLENRGTKVDTHVHIIDFGYLSLMLALIEPYVALSEKRKRRLAYIFLTGAVMLPVSVFLIHYIGLSYSPFKTIGWASISADTGGLLVIVACVGLLSGVLSHFRNGGGQVESSPEPVDQSWAARALLVGGTLLILAGFLHGAWYAIFDLERHETDDRAVLARMILHSRSAAGVAEKDMADASQAVRDYGILQAEKAVKIAAHSHIIEFGLLALLLSFIQRKVMLTERWKLRWVVVLLVGSVVLPLFVLMEVRMGLLAGGIADFGGLLVIMSLIGMLVGVIRHGGVEDWQERAE